MATPPEASPQLTPPGNTATVAEVQAPAIISHASPAEHGNAVDPHLTSPPPFLAVNDQEAAEDEEVDDLDDPFEDLAFDQGTTTSVSSSIFRYRQENGRLYNAYRPDYWGPCDEDAADFLDLANHLYLMMLGNKLYLAPIASDIQKVLDVGTGTGIWAIDFADQHPSAEVIGTDLAPMQPSWLPPNCKFEIDDATEEWTFRKDSFDFIHVRSMFGCIADWPKFYQEVLKHLKPGAYFEQLEMAPGFKCDDGTMDPETAYSQWHDLGIECGHKMGRSFGTMYEMKDFITAAGFEDVVETRFKLPIGPWMPGKSRKELGMWTRLHIEAGLENWAMAPLTRILGWSKQDVDIYIACMKRDLKNKQVHGYHEMRVVYARKPLNWVP